MKPVKKSLLLIFLLSAFSFTAHAQLNPFTTDGCSGPGVPDGLPNLSGDDDWRHCCVVHDISYWMGGEKWERRLADLNLESCIESLPMIKKRLPLQGVLYFSGVFYGGAPYYGIKLLKSPFPWRWGYGWQEKKNYHRFSPSEFDLVEVELEGFLKTLEEDNQAASKLNLSVEQLRYVTEKIKLKINHLKDRPFNH